MWVMAFVSVSSSVSELFPLRGRGRGIRPQKVVTVPTCILVHTYPSLLITLDNHNSIGE